MGLVNSVLQWLQGSTLLILLIQIADYLLYSTSLCLITVMAFSIAVVFLKIQFNYTSFFSISNGKYQPCLPLSSTSIQIQELNWNMKYILISVLNSTQPYVFS